MRGQKIGFRHTEEAKTRISLAMKGKAPLAIHVKRKCPTCDIEMGAGNMGRHAPVCAALAASGQFPGKTVSEVKTLRRKMRAYGITAEDYAAMWARQGGVCALCGGDNERRALSVDHDHQGGNVRGLLCDKCNLMLGYASDSPSRLRRAADYLERSGHADPESCDNPEFDSFKD
jgi:hypothetical protein